MPLPILEHQETDFGLVNDERDADRTVHRSGAIPEGSKKGDILWSQACCSGGHSLWFGVDLRKTGAEGVLGDQLVRRHKEVTHIFQIAPLDCLNLQEGLRLIVEQKKARIRDLLHIHQTRQQPRRHSLDIVLGGKDLGDFIHRQHPLIVADGHGLADGAPPIC
jgi:hypothetical protein